LIDADNILPISLQSLFMESNCFWVINSPFFSLPSQYSVSAHSFSAIVSFDAKSFFEEANLASDIFAPMLVPERSICFDIINSFLCLHKYEYILTILSANLSLLFFKGLSFIEYPTLSLLSLLSLYHFFFLYLFMLSMIILSAVSRSAQPMTRDHDFGSRSL